MITEATAASSPALLLLVHHGRRCRGNTTFISCSIFRRGRRRSPENAALTTKSSPFQDGKLNLRGFLDAAGDAYHDLRTSVTVDPWSGRLVFSCRQSSLRFAGNVLLCGLFALVLARVLLWLGLGFGRRLGFGGGDAVVTRRDRSLGGREVVVGRKEDFSNSSSRVSVSPLSVSAATQRGTTVESRVKEKRERERERELPDWWRPPTFSYSVQAVDDSGTSNMEQFRMQAQRLVRAITDYRMSGKDYRFQDIILLRQICKMSGAKVSFETENARDSLYRAAANFVLDFCSRGIRTTEDVEINGEDVREFISGLAHNIGLQNYRAATLVSAAVAARTRACFLQCWALDVQKKRAEALDELLKICLIHRIFPPEENSPEMEMVANGLKKNLQADEREHLFSLYKGVCPTDNHNAAGEALGLAIKRS